MRPRILKPGESPFLSAFVISWLMMPPVRTPKFSSTDRRKRLACRIEQLGFPAMAPCPQCVESQSVCIVQKQSSRCSCCTRKNIRCGGNFSDAEFDQLESQKTELLQKKVEV